jgi:two-component system nitrogen regulation sensor histidine kinase NtrY
VSSPRTALALAALLVAALLLFEVCARQLTGAWFTFGVHPEVLRQLELSLADQKRLAALDPAGAARYRRRFAALESLLGRLRVLAYNRDEVVGSYQTALLVVVAALAAAAGGVYLAGKMRQQGRLDRLRVALARLSAGEIDVEVGERRRDLIGRIGAMVEETSRAMARDRRRLASLENLAAWQEAARRQAHEMRTPLTAARLDLGRLIGLLEGGRDLDDFGDAGDAGEYGHRGDRGDAGDSGDTGDAGDAGRCRRRERRELAESVLQEIERLGRFTKAFTSFSRLPAPRLGRHDLGAFVAEFAATFGGAWPNLVLVVAAAPIAARPGGPGAAPASCSAAFDRDLLRQVLVNLCDNSSQALDSGPGTVTFRLGTLPPWVVLEVADDGSGISPAVLPRLFEPYATTRGVGQGMGLGLAISRKILLDHGGDLELARTSAAGSVFRLLLPGDQKEKSP